MSKNIIENIMGNLKNVEMPMMKKNNDRKDKYAELREKIDKTMEKEEEDKYPYTLTEWEEVEGYKATDENMMCQDFQYELGKIFSIPEEEVNLCSSGFHMCQELKDIFNFYNLSPENRFFKVRATIKKEYTVYSENRREIRGSGGFFYVHDKDVAKEITFLEELPIEKIEPFILMKYPLLTDLEKEWNLDFINHYKENTIKKYVSKIMEVSNFSESLCSYIIRRLWQDDKEAMDEIVDYLSILSENNLSNDTIYTEMTKKYRAQFNENYRKEGKRFYE